MFFYEPFLMANLSKIRLGFIHFFVGNFKKSCINFIHFLMRPLRNWYQFYDNFYDSFYANLNAEFNGELNAELTVELVWIKRRTYKFRVYYCP